MKLKVKTPDVVSEAIDGELIVIHLKTGFYYSFTDVGNYVWQALGRGVPVEKLGELISQKYDVSSEKAAADAKEFVSALLTEDLFIETEKKEEQSAEWSDKETNEKIPYKKPVVQKYDDMQDLIFLDPVHDVSEEGWPNQKPKTDASTL